jgi:hypothetical protein
MFHVFCSGALLLNAVLEYPTALNTNAQKERFGMEQLQIVCVLSLPQMFMSLDLCRTRRRFVAGLNF